MTREQFGGDPAEIEIQGKLKNASDKLKVAEFRTMDLALLLTAFLLTKAALDQNPDVTPENVHQAVQWGVRFLPLAFGLKLSQVAKLMEHVHHLELRQDSNPALVRPREPSARQLASAFVDQLVALPGGELEDMTKGQLKRMFDNFKEEHPLKGDQHRECLDLYLVFVQAEDRKFGELAKIIEAEGKFPTQETKTGAVVDTFYRIFEDDEEFWPK